MSFLNFYFLTIGVQFSMEMVFLLLGCRLYAFTL